MNLRVLWAKLRDAISSRVKYVNVKTKYEGIRHAGGLPKKLSTSESLNEV